MRNAAATTSLASEIEPEEDHRRGSERAVELRGAPELRREIEDDHEMDRLRAERQQRGSGQQVAPGLAAVRKLFHDPHGPREIEDEEQQGQHDPGAAELLAQEPGSTWTPRSARARLPRTRRSQRVGAEASPAGAPRRPRGRRSGRARPRCRTRGPAPIPASRKYQRAWCSSAIAFMADCVAAPPIPKSSAASSRPSGSSSTQKLRTAAKTSPSGTSQKKSRYAIPPASSPAAAMSLALERRDGQGRAGDVLARPGARPITRPTRLFTRPEQPRLVWRRPGRFRRTQLVHLPSSDRRPASFHRVVSVAG